MVKESRRWHQVALCLGLFLMVWGGKLAVIDRWGSDLPWWDDWPGIGANLLVPYERGELGIGHFFASHNEHRIACTRALDVALVAINGQWDARLECIVSAALHAIFVVFAFVVGGRLLPRFAHLAWFLGLAVLTAPPVVWENIVRGFDSQHYLLIGFSLAAIVGLMAARTGTAQWWGGLACAVVALFTMGSGMVAAIVVAVTLPATLPWKECWRRHRWTLLGCAVVIVAGIALRHDVPAHAAYRAHNTQEFAIAFWHHLQWPLVLHPSYGAVAWLPWAWLAWRCVRRDPATGVGERIVVAVGLWALAHYVAMAYMRGSLQPWPPTRGLENAVVGLAVNFFAVLVFVTRLGRARWRMALGWAVAVAGVAVGICGLASIIRENVELVLPSVAADARRAERNTRAFLATGDRAWLKSGEIPFPDVEPYAAIISLPEIQSMLPSSVRPPIPMQGTSTPPGSFASGGAPVEMPPPAGISTQGSYTSGGLAAVGEWRSAPVDPGRHAYWQFDVAGSLSAPGIVLELAAIKGGVVTRLPTRGTSAATWTTVVVPTPEYPATIVAQDRSAGAWLAFAGPTEVAAWSMGARWLCRRGDCLAIAGMVAAILGWWCRWGATGDRSTDRTANV